MKLADLNMDYNMEDLSMEKDASSIPSDSVNPPRLGDPNTFLQLTPSTITSQPATGQRPRRSTVSVACERCRKRKTKCSGLPGPCTNCARLNVPCHEPGRRKSSVQSTLEDRMQRLRTITAANRYTDAQTRTASGRPGVPSPTVQETSSIGTLPASGLYDLHVPSPVSAHSSEGWAAAGDPASYFDSRLQDVDWSMPDFQTDASLQHGAFGSMYAQRAQAQDFARASRNTSVPNEGLTTSTRETPNPSAYHFEGSVPIRERTPIGFTISYDLEDLDLKQDDSNPSTPFSVEQDTNIDEDINPLEDLRFMRQFSAETRPSMKSSPTFSARVLPQRSDSVGEKEFLMGYQLTRAQTVPTGRPPPSEPENFQETDLLSLIIRSSDTRKYIERYFTSVQNDYPFLDPAVLEEKRSLAEQLPNFNYNLVQRHTMVQFQVLMVAAIGALVQQESTHVSSQYVKQAASIQDQIEMWTSVGGIHCALLLSLYSYLAQIMVFDTRQDEMAEAQHSRGVNTRQSRYPVSNLWLHNCQIAAACIDLGMHQPLAMQEQIRSQTDVRKYLETCQSTIRSAYVLDRKISELRNRPRAFHDEDIDRMLLVDL